MTAPTDACPECGAAVEVVEVSPAGAVVRPCGHLVDVTITADRIMIEPRTP